MLQPARRRALARRLLRLALAVVLLGLAAYAVHRPLLVAAARFLIVSQEPEPADLLMVLNGSEDTRPVYASQLYRHGFSPRVAIARAESGTAVQLGLYPNATDVAVQVLQRLGVPAEHIVTIPVAGGVTSTRDEARALADYASANEIRRVIVVTSALHTRRARWVFRRQLAPLGIEVRMVGAPHIGYDASNWWRRERGLVGVTNEYLKLLYYLWNYR